MDNIDNFPADNTPQLPNPKPKVKRRKYDKRVHGKRFNKPERLAIKAQYELGNVSKRQLARDNRCHPNTIDKIVNDKSLTILSPQEIDVAKRGIISQSLKVSLASFLSITPEKLEKLNAFQNGVLGKLSFENARLGLNESTSNVSHRGFIDNLDEEKSKLLDKLKDLGI